MLRAFLDPLQFLRIHPDSPVLGIGNIMKNDLLFLFLRILNSGWFSIVGNFLKVLLMIFFF